MIYVEEIYILIFIKVITFALLKRFYSKSNIYTELFFCLGYDLSTDFANYLYKVHFFSRPVWLNMFLGTGIIWFLTKIYAFEQIITFLTKKKKNNFFILKLISIFIGINQLVINTVISIKYKLFQDFIPINLKPHFLPILNEALLSTVPIIILMHTLIKILKSNNIKKNNLASFQIDKFIFIGILLKIFFDFVQAGSFKFIEKIINQKIIFHSIFYTSLSSWISLIFIYHMFKFLNEEEKYKTECIDLNHFENPEDSNELLIKLEDYYLQKIIYENLNIQEIFIHNTKKSISLKTGIKYDDILIYPINNEVFKPLENNEHEFYLDLFKQSTIYAYLQKNKYISKEYLYTYLYFTQEKNSFISDSFNFLEKHNIAFIGLWNKQDIQTNIIHNGIVIIKNSNEKKIEKEDLFYFIKHIELIEKIEQLFLKTSNFIIQKTKEKYETIKLEYFYKYQQEVFKELNELETNIKINYIEEHQLKSNYNEQLEPLNEISYQTIFKQTSTNTSQTKIIKKHHTTHLIKLLKADKKNSALIHIEIPRIIPPKLDTSRESSIYLPFTQIGKKINHLIKIEKYQYHLFKKEILDVISNIGSTILVIENKYFEIIEKIIQLTLPNFTYTIDNENKNILNLFDKQITINDQTTFLTKFFKEEDGLIIQNIDEYTSKDQKILSEYMLYKKDPFEKYLGSIPSKIILTVNNEDHISFINQNILSVSKIKKMNNILLENSYKEELLSILIDSSLFFHNESVYNDAEKIKIGNDLYKYKNYLTVFDILLIALHKEQNISSYFKNSFKEHESKYIEEITAKASSLGKDSLKNHKLMNQLINHYNQNQIASLIGVNRSSISRYFKENRSEKD